MRLFRLLASSGIHEEYSQTINHMISLKENTPKMSPEMTSNVKLHGILLWASMGLLMPLGIFTIRMSNKVQSRRKAKVFFYLHAVFEVLSVILSTIGAVMSIRNFENSFNNNHQRLGLVLYAAMWVQVLIGFLRPSRGNKRRSTWFFAHWLFGTAISLSGIINIYTGLKAYHNKSSKSTTIWTILFTAQTCFMAFLYLFQDKWEYIQKQGVNLETNNNNVDHGHQPAAAVAAAASVQVVTTDRDHEKVLVLQPNGKRNALMNLFE